MLLHWIVSVPRFVTSSSPKIHWSFVDPAQFSIHRPARRGGKREYQSCLHLCHVGSNVCRHHVRRFLIFCRRSPFYKRNGKGVPRAPLHSGFMRTKTSMAIPATRFTEHQLFTSCARIPPSFYDHRGGSPMSCVRFCGMRRFQRGLDFSVALTKSRWPFADHSILTELWVQENCKQRTDSTPDNAKALRQVQSKLDNEKESIADIESPCN